MFRCILLWIAVSLATTHCRAGAQANSAASLEGRLNQAHALLESGHKAEALSAFEALGAEAPANPAVQFGLAAALLETGAIEESLQLLESLKTVDPQEVATRAYLARAYLQLGSAVRARAELAEVRRLSPYADLLHAQLVEWCYQSRLHELAQEQIDYFLTLPTSEELRGRVRYLQGVLAYEQGQSAEAVEALEHAVRESPRHENYWSALLAAEGVSDIAAVNPGTLDRALDLFPESPAILSLLALREIRFERLERAREIEQRIRKSAPGDPAADLVLGRLELEALQFEEAANAFRKVLDKAPKDHRARLGLGVALARLGQADEALASFNQALAIEPFDGETLYEKARVLADLEQAAEAAAVLDRLLERDPTQERAAYLMFRLQTKLGNTEAASRWREAFLAARGSGSP